MNLLFFVPLGVFGRLLLRLRFWTVVLLGLLISLAIETAQLTGLFGIYPCSYRLFDVDDVLINLLGAVIGFGFAKLLPQHELIEAGRSDIVRRAGLIRHISGFLVDSIISYALFVVLVVGTYLLTGKDAAAVVGNFAQALSIILVFGLVPYLSRGWSIGGALVRLNHDDKKRGKIKQLLFYIARVVFVMLILLVPSDLSWITPTTIVISLLIWRKYHKLPYQLI